MLGGMLARVLSVVCCLLQPVSLSIISCNLNVVSIFVHTRFVRIALVTRPDDLLLFSVLPWCYRLW